MKKAVFIRGYLAKPSPKAKRSPTKGKKLKKAKSHPNL